MTRRIQFRRGARHFSSQRGLRLADQGFGVFAGLAQGRVALLQLGVPVHLALPVDLLPGRLKGRFILVRLGLRRRGLFAGSRHGPHRQLLALLHHCGKRAEENPVQNDEKEEHQQHGG